VATEKLDCYSRLYTAHAEVASPRNADELADHFAHAREMGRKVTLRAGAHSFDAQALGDDLVISMLNMNEIEVLADEGKVRVGSGATWGSVLAELKPHGLVPAVTVTTEHATAGGTLSGDCLSRFSPSYGKEGEQIESFDLLTTAGELITCTAPPKDAPQSSWTREQRAFCGVISGLGYLGAVVSITYRVRSPGRPGDRIGVRTLAYKTDTFAELGKQLMPKVREAVTEVPDPRDPEKLDAIWSALDTRGPGRQTALLFTSAFVTNSDGKRMLLHRPELLRRILAEWAMRVPFISRLMWRFYVTFLFRKKQQEYIDELEGFTFFMDGNARAKRIGNDLGLKMQNAQQTFVVPRDPDAEGSWDRARDDLVKWLQFASKFLRDRGLTPTLHDVLYLPRDLPFALSASADVPGFAASYAFETSNAKRLARVKQAFIELADVLWEDYGGRVYLVKNVFARPETLRNMYADHLDEFHALKAELDPSDTLRNEFYDRTVRESS